MNSLVVLFSVMVLAAAKPSIPVALSYAAPALALAPAAVSHQSRIDIKSSPAIVKTEIVSPVVERTFVAKPAILAAPLAYAAPIAAAPAAVSTQSRIDIKSSPAVVSGISAAPLAYNAPLAFGASLAYGAPLTYSAPLATGFTSSIYAPAIAPAILKTAALAPVAVSAKIDAIEPALPVAPTDTPEVAAARAAHLEAKKLEESHQIQKRSAAIVATSPIISTYSAPIVSNYAASPIVYSPPVTRIGAVAVHSPVLPSAYGIHAY